LIFLKGFLNSLKSIPENIRKGDMHQSYNIKDIVARSSPGIGSAGKVSYSILVEGPLKHLKMILFFI
jgi:hypothetical protein